jgi:anti-sigma factor ChrR (cupin superfamily)
MNHDPTVPTPHPEDLLAAYVDGSAAPAEQEAVEAHLLTCAPCRDEVEMARTARVALSNLQELEAPTVTSAVMASLGKAGGPATDRRQGVVRLGDRRQRMAWAAGLAAAAAVAAIFLFTGVLGDGSFTADQPASESAKGAVTAEGSPIPIHQGGDHTQETLAVLAQNLADDVDSGRAPLAATETDAASPAAPSPSEASADRVLDVATCVQQGAGLGPESQPMYLEEATFGGSPIYVGAFIIPASAGQGEHLELVAVTTDDCQPVYFARI